MAYNTKDYNNLLGLEGFSNELLKNHFKLYQGYVMNMNKLNDILVSMEKDGDWGTPEFAELNRRLGWEFNGMRLHELYFGNITKKRNNIDKKGKLFQKIVKEWGSMELWLKDFESMGAMRGIGWVILYYDKESNRLFNVWINEHDLGHLTGAVPLLVMDVFEHAFMIDYGLDKASYIKAFIKSIDWDIVSKRI